MYKKKKEKKKVPQLQFICKQIYKIAIVKNEIKFHFYQINKIMSYIFRFRYS